MTNAHHPPYPAYKPSGVDWLGDIPAHWEVRRLKFVASINPDTLPETTPKDYAFEYIDIGNVSSDGRVSAIQEYTFETAPTRARRKVNTGDTIISTVRTYLQAIAYIEDNLSNCIVSTGFAVLRPKENVHSRFLYYLVRSQGFVDAVMAHSSGVSYPAIAPTSLAGLWGLLPPLAEQRAIAEYLDRETAHIDALIAKKRELIDLLERQRTALISHAVTRGLNPATPLKPSGVDWLGEIPAHWEVRRLKFVAAQVAFKLEQKPSDKIYLGLESIESGTGRLLLDSPVDTVESVVSAFQSGDVLFSKLRPYLAKVVHADFDGVCTSELMVLRPNRGFLDDRFLFYFMLSHGFISVVDAMTYGAKMPRASPSHIADLAICLPPLAEQRAIAEYLDRETAQIDRLKGEVEASIDLLQHYRTALISAAVTGKIDVRVPAAASCPSA